MRPRPPRSSSWPPSSAVPRTLQLLETLRGRDDQLTRAPRAQGGLARRVDGPVERRRCWRSTSSGSSRSLYVPLALSGPATGSSEHSCASVSCGLTSFTVRAVEPSMAPSSVLVSKARLFARRSLHDGAARCSSCLSRKDPGPGCQRCPSRRPYSSRRPSEPSRRGRVLTRPYPPSRAPEGRGCTLVSRSHRHCPCGTTVRPATT